MLRNLRSQLRSRSGEMFYEVIVKTLIVVAFLLTVISLYGVFIRYQNVNYLCKRIVRAIEVEGQVSGGIDILFEELNTQLGLDASYQVTDTTYFDASRKIQLSPHPFDNVETRHPLHCRRVSRIMGKYAGGVFCELEKGFTCLCLYSPEQKDENFDPGDNVIIVVTRYDYANKLVYGRIVTGW